MLSRAPAQKASRLTQVGALLCALAFTAIGHAEDPPVSFNKDVRTILSDKCFQCHGPDQETLEADLRLDSFAGATALRDGFDRPAIVPGDASKSALIERITTHDRSDLMPPPKIKKPLTAAEIDTLRRWIDQGAAYEGHWAFLPIDKPAPPTIADPAKAKNPIDNFIRDAQQARDIPPSPEADPRTLVRRLHLDLIGLLPAPELVEKFVTAYKKNPDGAVSILADQLLNSPHHGERWARHWLDQARYADSNGYTIDGERTMWPYRDWVIRAIGDDMPFDKFTIEQLAGDLLPNPTKAQLVASGFHRNTLINQEGGTDDEQFRDEEVTDRVNTTGAVWLGLTVGCAQCHTHKFDPITHREFYELFAFFNNTEDVNNTGPTVEIAEGELFFFDSNPELSSQLEAAQKKLAALNHSSARAKRQAAWEKVRLAAMVNATSADWSALDADTFTAEGGAPLKKLKDGSLFAGVGAKNETYEVFYRPASNASDEGGETPTTVAALRLRVLPDDGLPKRGPGLAGNGNFVLTHFEIWQGDRQLIVDRVQADHSQPGHDVGRLIDDDEQTGWAINVGKGSAPGAKMNAEHEAHFILAEPVSVAPDERLRIVLRHNSTANSNYNVGRFAVDCSPTPPAEVGDDNLLAALRTETAKRDDAQKKLLSNAFTSADTERKKADAEIAAIKNKLGYGPSAKAMVMRELAKPRQTFLHKRGSFLDFDRELGPLQPGVPAFLPELKPADKTKPANRLDLARWLVRSDHPLTARVTVNRVWMRYFGHGLVKTENDFGTQGSFPTHPELLDWLARRFIEDGWSMRKLHKLIVTSATYRQSSHARPDLKEIDPLNHLLARQNRIRFDAEIVRDAALSASGLLSTKIGGRSVRPPQPDGIYAFTQRKPNWTEDKGPDRYRRAMYTQFYRSAPYPLLTTFDAPDFQSVCTRRPRSNTPLQSLTLANSSALFEIAQGLGKRMTETKGDEQARIDAGFQWCFARPPSESERASVLTFFENQRQHFLEHPGTAKKIADTPEAAAWVTVARALMNTDEFITRE
jgi:hypothetical protein